MITLDGYVNMGLIFHNQLINFTRYQNRFTTVDLMSFCGSNKSNPDSSNTPNFSDRVCE